MKKALNRRDLELISAYLDQQVKAGDRQKVETRLRSDPQFRDSYEQIRQTRQMIRSLPAKRAPRNFTLSPSQARITTFQRLRPVFGMSSALATFLLLLALVGDLLFINPRLVSKTAASNPNVPQVALQSNAAESSTAQDSTLLAATAPALAKEAPAGSALAAPTETPAPPRAAGPLNTTSTPAATSEPQGLTAQSLPAVSETPSATAGPAALRALPTPTAAGELYDQTGPALQETPPQVLAATHEPAPSQASGTNTWVRWLEGFLALAAVVTGALFIFARRAGR